MAPTLGSVLRQARDVRELSAIEAARSTGISTAYLNKLENDVVKRPSPHVLHQLGEALGLPYADLMRLSGYQVPGESDGDGVIGGGAGAIGSALFANLSDDETEELLEYLAWYRARRRSKRGA